MAQPAIDFFCSFSLSTRVTRPFGQLARPEICREFENSVQTPYTAHFKVLSYVPMGIEQQPLSGATNVGPSGPGYLLFDIFSAILDFNPLFAIFLKSTSFKSESLNIDLLL
jgi:hypothetical protein